MISERNRRRFGVMLGCCLWAGAAGAAESVSIDGTWCRLSDMRVGTAFVYLTLTAPAPEGDTLVGASAPIAAVTELLAPKNVNGRETLQPSSAIVLDPHGPTIFQPQGPHIILKGIKQKLVPGNSFVITLKFDHAGSQDAMVEVVKQSPAAGMPTLPKGVKLE